MRLGVVMALAAATVLSASARAAPVDDVFREFGLFGSWASDCAKPASPDNPHVNIAALSPGIVLESHDLGPDYAVNRYSFLSAEKLSADEVAVDVIFQPGREGEERQKLIFRVRKGTRRTLFNQPAGGAVLVKGGIALANGSKTPVLNKCE